MIEENSDNRKCLNCGKELHGRPDKLFCSGQCKNDWHNRLTRDEKRNQQRVFGILRNNYKILELMIELNERTPVIAAMENSGFRPEFVTGYRRTKGRIELRCFDIIYNTTEARLYNIRRAPEVL